MWSGGIVGTVLAVHSSQALRNEQLDWLPQQLIGRVTEDHLRLTVDQPDAAAAVDHYGGVRSQLRQRLEAKEDFLTVLWTSWRLGSNRLGSNRRMSGALVVVRGVHRSAILSHQLWPSLGVDLHMTSPQQLCSNSQLLEVGTESLTEHHTTWQRSLCRQ